jgi:hypothetical protein
MQDVSVGTLCRDEGMGTLFNVVDMDTVNRDVGIGTLCRM